MSNHMAACEESKALCDKLYDCLSKKITNLKRSETKTWCALYQLDRARFAYVSHRKKMSRIEIWCLGDSAELQKNTSLHVIPREEIKGEWANRFQARFRV
ncbi:MAG: hypothetical protein KAR20_18870, partial [Candidatus Heimdallarchaeota archaeon]|nr:hypothetical protein [Candidatus Heimdallarchaeota archaeon]